MLVPLPARCLYFVVCTRLLGLVHIGDKIDRVEVDFVASVYEALVLRSGSTELVFSISINRKNGVGDKDCINKIRL